MESLKIAAVVLAAGNSSRMGVRNKLLMDIKGKTVIKQVVDGVLSTGIGPVLVILGYQAGFVRKSLGEQSVKFKMNPNWKAGMATSIIAGVESIPGPVDGAMIVLGDMPTLDSKTLQHLVMTFREFEGRKIVYPTYNSQQGNPVIFPKSMFSELMDLKGDRGGKSILENNLEMAVAVNVENPCVLWDVDTQAELKEAKRILRGVINDPS